MWDQRDINTAHALRKPQLQGNRAIGYVVLGILLKTATKRRRMTAIFETPTTGIRSFGAALRITVLAMACLLTAKAHAEWNILTVNLDKTVTIWLESSSVQRRDDYVFAWVIYDRENATEDGAMSSKALNQYDCANRQARTWLQSIYTKSMAGGEPMPPRGKAQCEANDSLEIRRDDDCAQTWKPVLYRTTGSDILKALCVGQAAYLYQ